MIFEEALKLMREGAKITNPFFDDDVYFEGCYMSLLGETFEEAKERGMSIAKMKGDTQHPDMGCGGGIDSMVYPGTMIIKEQYLKEPCKHGNMPQLNLLLVMSDDWKIWEKKT